MGYSKLLKVICFFLHLASLPANAQSTQNPKTAATEGQTCVGCYKQNALGPKALDMLNNINEVVLSNKQDPTQHPAILAYSQNISVIRTINHALKHKKPSSEKLCYRYVKRALKAGGLVDEYLPGVPAKEGIKDLKGKGFINLLEDPRFKNQIKTTEDAPKGAILVYRNTKDSKHPGHIEIKTDWGQRGGYVSDFYRSTETTLYNRELIGVMIKENL